MALLYLESELAEKSVGESREKVFEGSTWRTGDGVKRKKYMLRVKLFLIISV